MMSTVKKPKKPQQMYHGVHGDIHLRKAVMSEAGLAQALHIWRKYLCLQKFKFKEAQHLTEKKISMTTWEGCTSTAYDQNPDLYKRWNSRVLEYWYELEPKCRMIRIRDTSTTPPTTGKLITRICRSDKQHAITKLKHKTNIAAGVMVGAIQDNEKFELEQNVGSLFLNTVDAKVRALPGMTDEKAKQLVSDITIQQAFEAGRIVGKDELVQGVLGVLDNKPALIEADSKNNDKYTFDANERRRAQEEAKKNG